MSIICEDCGGDGLHHDNPDVFESFQDDVCPQCQGTGVTEEAGNPIQADKVWKATNTETDIEFYIGELADKFQEFPVRFQATYEPADHGEWEGGLQISPSHPAGYEVDDYYVLINKEWYSFNAEEESAGLFKTVGDFAENYMEA